MLQITKALRLAFENKEVQVVLKNVYAFVLEKDETGHIQKQGAATVAGVFLDHDDIFLYLGTDSGEITQAISIENIALIALPDDEGDEEILKFLSFPGSDKEIN
jgi:hypothetical protein